MGNCSMLHPATSQNMKLNEAEELKQAFEVLQDNIKSPPMVAFPDFDMSAIMETSANSFATESVLVNNKEDGEI